MTNIKFIIKVEASTHNIFVLKIVPKTKNVYVESLTKTLSLYCTKNILCILDTFFSR